MSVNAGFDIGKDFHWLAATDNRGLLLTSHKVHNTPEDIDTAITELRTLEAEHGDLRVGLDVLGGIAGLLCGMLLEADIACLHVPGLAVNRARRGTRGGENKSDPRDAKVIAEQVMLRTDLRPVDLPEDADVEVRLLVSHRRTLTRDSTRIVARLRDLLVGIHPGLEQTTDPTNKSSLLLLARYVTPGEVRRAGERRITDHLVKAGVGAPLATKLAQAAVASARAQRTALPGERRTADLIRELAGDLLRLRERHKALDAELEELLARHPDAALIRSLPGMGAILTAEFIAVAGTISRFDGPDALAACAGLAPVLTQSGRMRYSRSALGGDKVLKRVFYQAAFCALQRHPASRAFYDRKRSQGKRHHQALISLARRRVNVLFAILRDRRPYEDRPALRLVA